jgi:hypothetical protein
MHYTLISPRLALQKGDFLGSGVPYWPVELATLAAFLEERGDDVDVIDLFGANPQRLTDCGDHYLQGEDIAEHLGCDAAKLSDLVVVYAISYMSHTELLEIVSKLATTGYSGKIAVLENSQAVTAYSIAHVADQFFQAGADALICGEPYQNWEDIVFTISGQDQTFPAPNVLTRKSGISNEHVRRLSNRKASYPVPAWRHFNIANYWKLPYAHGPKSRTYLPVLTSRGCPYPCDFCVIPETNERRWRGNTPDDVVDEFISLRDQFGVHDFQIEDVNPTVNSKRWCEIAELLIQRKAGIRYGFVSGTKAETVPLDELETWAASGCRFISISPESGSADVMRSIGKPFNFDYAEELVGRCRALNIRTQACFLVGHPSDTDTSHENSLAYVARLVRAGLDEIAVFVVASFAGSELYENTKLTENDGSALPSFSPKGREDYALLAGRRREMLRLFFREKLKRGGSLWMQGIRALLGHPETKMENLPRRVFFIWRLVLRHKLANAVK